ncbi:MAG: orotidine-5'-phosphate decarboxylase [Euryarchaeota archaeon]|nr:orotidine-5'-phosphate decarboxylase [Euryarchaeota archaeon]
MRKDTRIVLALDETDERKALQVVDEVGELVDAIKINWPLVLSAGPSIITELAQLSSVICDFKVADIPNTVRLIAEQAFRRGASGLIVHAFTGTDSLRAAVEAAAGKDIFVVTEMSHPGGQEHTAPLAERFAAMAAEAGASGVIAPATRPERIAKIRSVVGDMLILSPGVGAQGGSASAAIRMGADYVIVGRSIYKSEHPRKVAQALAREISTSL